ncbi:MAG: 50S ribosomal protein L13 [bacterium]
MKTYTAKPKDIKRRWHLIDASDVVLGRLATQVATILRGKNKPIFTPHIDTGDYVIIVNADKIKVTGKKAEDKFYFRPSPYAGHSKKIPFKKLSQCQPEEVIRRAVLRMLPKNKLSRMTFKKLFVYAANTHPHMAQQPKLLKIFTGEN